MTNRTDWPELTAELQQEHGFDDACAARLATELHNAFIAGAERNPWRGDMNGAVALLQLLTDRAPPPPERRHALMLTDGVLVMAIAIPYGTDSAFLSFRLDGRGDLDRTPEDLAGAIMTLLPKAIEALASGDPAVLANDRETREPGKAPEPPAPRPDPPPSEAAGGESHPTPEPPRQPRDLVFDIAISCASFIAAIPDSATVANYLAQRLAPILGYVPDQVLRAIAQDGRPAPERPR